MNWFALIASISSVLNLVNARHLKKRVAELTTENERLRRDQYVIRNKRRGSAL